MDKVPVRSLVGGKARCKCGSEAAVQPGRNKASALGSTAPPPPRFLSFLGKVEYVYPPLGPVWYQDYYIIECPKCGNYSRRGDEPIEPVPDPNPEASS